MQSDTTQSTAGLRQPAVLGWMRLARVFQKLDGASEKFFKEYDLNPAQFDVLARVGAAEGLTQQQLARSLLVTKGNISQLLDRMEQKGIVTRRHEGRTNCIWLTEHGRTLFEAIVPQQEALIANLFASLTPDEQQQLHTLLRKLDRSLE